jgi:hypothetical protein
MMNTAFEIKEGGLCNKIFLRASGSVLCSGEEATRRNTARRPQHAIERIEMGHQHK